MKVTEEQLKRIIREEVERVYLEEGLWDTIKGVGKAALDTVSSITSKVTDPLDRATGGVPENDVKKFSTPDAFKLYKAMAGVGTDEDEIRDVLESRAEDIPKLYEEFNELIMGWVKAKTAGLEGGFDVSMIESYNHDLIDWLESDGMDEEASFVEKSLKAAGVSRKEPPVKVSNKGLLSFS